MNRELIEFIQENISCIVCGTQPVDAHHVTTVKAGGDDTATNLFPACREHHGLWHLKGPCYMIKSFPSVKRWLTLAEREDILRRCLSKD